MDANERLALLSRVLTTAYRETQTWRDPGIGAELAYLAMAISTDKPSEQHVDWTTEQGGDCAQLFRRCFQPDDPVWSFITARWTN